MKKTLIGIVVVIAVVLIIVIGSQNKNQSIKIGIVTPLSGDLAFWGEGTVLGAQMAVDDLKKKGIDVSVIAEDGGLDPKKALDAGQKLLNVDGVQAMFPEFNPAAIALSSYLKDKNVLEIYDAAPFSPLSQNLNALKTYIDFKTGCKSVAQYIRDKGVQKIGILEMNLEFSQLCTEGIGEVYDSSSLYKETYNAGDTDLRTQLVKIKQHDPDIIFNISLTPENFVAIRNLEQVEIGDILYVGVADSFPTNLVEDYKSQMKNKIIFGLPPVSKEFIAKVTNAYPDKDIFAYEPVAIGYLHTMQIGEALNECKLDIVCAREEVGNSEPSNIIGFKGFTDRVAQFDIQIQEWIGGEFVNVK